jgi:hypothetical protein
MRFLTALILSISFAVAGENASEGASKPKQSRGKSILRAIGNFGGSLVLSDPYQEVRSSKKSVRQQPATSPSQSAPESETPQPPAEKSETHQPQK